jgi:hypothetical protein
MASTLKESGGGFAPSCEQCFWKALLLRCPSLEGS